MYPSFRLIMRPNLLNLIYSIFRGTEIRKKISGQTCTFSLKATTQDCFAGPNTWISIKEVHRIWEETNYILKRINK